MSELIITALTKRERERERERERGISANVVSELIITALTLSNKDH